MTLAELSVEQFCSTSAALPITVPSSMPKGTRDQSSGGEEGTNGKIHKFSSLSTEVEHYQTFWLGLYLSKLTTTCKHVWKYGNIDANNF